MDRKLPAKTDKQEGDEKKEDHDGHGENTNGEASNEGTSNEDSHDGNSPSAATASRDERAEEGRASSEAWRGQHEAGSAPSRDDRMMTLRGRQGQRLTLPAPDLVKSDELALMLVECSGTPGAYHATLPDSARGGATAAAASASGPIGSHGLPQPHQERREEDAVPNAPPATVSPPSADVDAPIAPDDRRRSSHASAQADGDENASDDQDALAPEGAGFATTAETTATLESVEESKEQEEEEEQDRVALYGANTEPFEAFTVMEDVDDDEEGGSRGLDDQPRREPLVEAELVRASAVSDRRKRDASAASTRAEARCFRKTPIGVVTAIVIVILAIPVPILVVFLSLNSDSDDSSDPGPPSPSAAADFSEFPSSFPSPFPSASPSSEEHSSRYEDMLDLAAAVSSAGSLSDQDSAQYRAIQWLVDEDLVDKSDMEDEELVQRYVAALLVMSCDDLKGDILLENFTQKAECVWNAPPQTISVPGGILCDENDKIVSVNFGTDFCPLRGLVPPEIGQLSRLQGLVLLGNPNLSGTVPSSVTSLSTLEYVMIDGSRINDTVPLFDSPNMRTLVLSRSLFYGTIPSELGSFENLSMLTLSENDLTGTIPDALSDLKLLAVLGLRRNRLRGQIPSSLGALQDDLVLVLLSNNELNGTIPEGLLSRENLIGLWLDDNNLTGSIGTEFGQMSDLKTLFLHSNKLSSVIPPHLGNSKSLKNLELGNNLLVGNVPQTLRNLTNLVSISLVDNAGLEGDINFLCNMTSVSNLYVDCPASNSKLNCSCCGCCSDQGCHTCGQYGDSAQSFRFALYIECCVMRRCGSFQVLC